MWHAARISCKHCNLTLFRLEKVNNPRLRTLERGSGSENYVDLENLAAGSGRVVASTSAEPTIQPESSASRMGTPL